MATSVNENQNEWYRVMVQNTEFTLPRRYEQVKYIGSGRFGSVVWVEMKLFKVIYLRLLLSGALMIRWVVNKIQTIEVRLNET